jgi:CelD/BcsL family acetyltransferase involved in cellulose biosynthesis
MRAAVPPGGPGLALAGADEPGLAGAAPGSVVVGQRGAATAATAATASSVEIGLLADPAALALEWQALERESAASFFTGWTWVSCWLEHLDGAALRRLVLLRVRQGGRTVGLGLWSRRTLLRLRCLPSRALLLHATGRPELDDLSAEHNALLARADIDDEVVAAACAALLERCPGIDQLVVPRASVLPPAVAALAAGAGLRLRSTSEPAYRIDLQALGARPYLDTLGAATRSAVRRSLRLYEALGPVRLESAASVPEALHFLERLRHWHQRHWRARGLPGAFANPRFEAFHQKLVARGFDAGAVRLLRLRAGAHEVGLLYAFVHRGQMLVYQSGLHLDLVERNHHPGLVLHALAVQHAADSGLQGYDLMAGEARYKRQLASECYPMLTWSLHRPGPALWLEEGWRAAKRRIAGPPERGAGPAQPEW